MWDIPPPGCWPTELKAAELRLGFGMLLHPRLGAHAHCRVFARDTDVLASIGTLIVGRPPLKFTRAPRGADIDSCDSIVYATDGGRGTAVCSHARMHSGVHYAEFSLLAGDVRGIRVGIVRANFVPNQGHWATDSHWQPAENGRGDAAQPFAGDVAHSEGWCFDPSAGMRPTRIRALLAPRQTHSPFEGAPGHLAQTFTGEECAIGDKIGIQLAFCGDCSDQASATDSFRGLEGGCVSTPAVASYQHLVEDDIQVELTIFRNGEEIGVLLLRDIPLEEGVCWAVQYTTGGDAVRIRAVDPTRQPEHHRWAWSVHQIATMGTDWIRTMSTTPMDFDDSDRTASVDLHAVECYPGVDLSLLWPPGLCTAKAENACMQLEQKRQYKRQKQAACGWELLRTIILIATGAAWGLRWYADSESWLAVLQNETMRMVAIRLHGI